MFGWTLIRKADLKEFEKAYITQRQAINCHRWFSGWKDLDIIWDFLLKPDYFENIDVTRDRYAKARGTDCYGNPSVTVEDK